MTWKLKVSCSGVSLGLMVHILSPQKNIYLTVVKRRMKIDRMGILVWPGVWPKYIFSKQLVSLNLCAILQYKGLWKYLNFRFMVLLSLSLKTSETFGVMKREDCKIIEWKHWPETSSKIFRYKDSLQIAHLRYTLNYQNRN